MVDVAINLKMLELLSSGNHPWSFGQFVAVSVWGPLCLKLVMALIIWFLPQWIKDLLSIDLLSDNTSSNSGEERYY